MKVSLVVNKITEDIDSNLKSIKYRISGVRISGVRLHNFTKWECEAVKTQIFLFRFR